MFRKELVILCCLATAVFLLVALLSSWAVRAVQREGTMLAMDTFPSLVNAGEAINRTNENWFDSYLLLNLDSPAARSNLIRKISNNSTLLSWQRYSASIFDQTDRQLFSQMERDRDDYLAKRVQYFDLIEAGKMAEAKSFFELNLKPAFEKYRDSARNVFTFNAKVGQSRADRVIRFSWWTPYALAGFCVMLVLAGVLLGFKASLGAFSGAWPGSLPEYRQ
jgi:Four helix bundle sensory module for signal transduction